MKILVAPLNWGWGHAARCIPVIQKFLTQGHTVVLGGDGSSLIMLQQYFPELTSINFPKLNLHYSSHKSQVTTILWQMPKLVKFIVADHIFLSKLLQKEKFDLVVSDNRFGLWNKHAECIYITHQLMIKLPQHWQFLEPVARKMHGYIIGKYSKCYVPDEAEQGGLSGDLSHKYPLPKNARFIGTLSRFATQKTVATENQNTSEKFQIVALLSGLEPQRSIFENEIIQQYSNRDDKVLIVQGKVLPDKSIIQMGNISVIPQLPDDLLKQVLLGCHTIIARSGYSTIMDLKTLGVLGKAKLTPTPGQPEQEYLAAYINQKYFPA